MCEANWLVLRAGPSDRAAGCRGDSIREFGLMLPFLGPHEAHETEADDKHDDNSSAHGLRLFEIRVALEG